MTMIDERITQFEKMASDDPDNDMAHFSLGGAYLQADRPADAAKSLEKCIELNPEMSKAYQLAGEAMVKAGWEDRAADLLTKGYTVATRRGDRLPQQEIAKLLERLGRPVPEVDVEAELKKAQEASGGKFICRRTGRPGTQLDKPPFRGPVGQWIYENISAETWNAWIGQGTKVINELRLDFSREQDQDTFDQHMHEFLGLDEDTLAQIRRK